MSADKCIQNTTARSNSHDNEFSSDAISAAHDISLITKKCNNSWYKATRSNTTQQKVTRHSAAGSNTQEEASNHNHQQSKLLDSKKRTVTEPPPQQEEGQQTADKYIAVNTAHSKPPINQ